MKHNTVWKKGFIETVEQSPALLYADTDSLYICAQNKNETEHGEDFKDIYITNKNDKDQWPNVIEQANIMAREINDEIGFQLAENLGTRAGLDPDYQSIFFKTEVIEVRMIQFNVKKTYALAYFYDEGKILENPVTKKTGGQINKSSTPRLSKRVFEDIYYNLLYTDVQTVEELKEKIFVELYNKHINDFKSYFDAMNFREIGLPYKYGFGKNMTKWIWGAMFYNTFFKDELRPGASMYALYIRYNQNKLKNLLMKNKFNSFQLNSNSVDRKWDMISIPVELGSEFYDLYKKEIDWLKQEIDFELSWDHNKDIVVDKKFLQFKTFFV